MKTLELQQTLSLANLEENMVFVEGGEFDMGGESWLSDANPIHRVQLSDFYICRFPVTQQLWYEITGEKPAHFSNLHRPVERVSWDDINDKFLPALQKKTGIYDFCLPSEAQWEYAARGGKYGNRKHIFAGSDYIKELDWINRHSHRETQPSELKRPNALGVYGMSGNVLEWCEDWFHEKYYPTSKEQLKNLPALNPMGPKIGDSKVARGGSWIIGAFLTQLAPRNGYPPLTRSSDVSFRLCRYSGR